MSSGVIVNINDKTMKELEKMPDIVMYAAARQFLDRLGASKVTPYKKGDMERSMFEAGVKGSDRNYYIGNFTNYAGYVYAFPNSVNWTNPMSQAQWFETYWKANGKMIVENVVARYKI